MGMVLAAVSFADPLMLVGLLAALVPVALHLLNRMRAPVVVLSFSDEGFLEREEIEAMLGELCGGRSESVLVIEKEYPRYVGAKIGIYNPEGKKVGKVSHVRNREMVYVARVEGREAANRVRAGVGVA